MIEETSPGKGGQLARRITDRNFLLDCPPAIAELFRYWDERRGDRAMPTRADISPMDFRRHLPDILLVDVEAQEKNGLAKYRYRVVGTREVSLRGHDPTGKPVEEGFFGPSREDVIACYELVRRKRSFLYDPLEYTTPDGQWRDEYTIFLPLSEDGKDVSQILVYSVKRDPRAG